MNPLASTTGVLVLGLLVLQIQIQPGAAQVSKSLQDEVDLNRPKCEALLDDAYATFEKSGESGMVRQLYRDYLAVPTGPFVWCSDESHHPPIRDAFFLPTPPAHGRRRRPRAACPSRECLVNAIC